MNILTNQNQIKYTFCHPELGEGSQQTKPTKNIKIYYISQNNQQ